MGKEKNKDLVVFNINIDDILNCVSNSAIEAILSIPEALPNVTGIANQYGGIAGKAAKMVTYALELSTVLGTIRAANNFFDVTTKANALGLTLNLAGLITNTDGLVTSGKEIADSGVKSLANYGRELLPEQFVDTTEDLLTCLGHSAKEALNELPLNLAKMINSADKIKTATKTIVTDISNFNPDNVLFNAGLIASANLAVQSSTKTQKAANKLKLPVDLSYLIEAKHTAINYIHEALPEEIIFTTEKIMNYVYEILATDYVSILTNTAGILTNYNKLHNLGNKLVKNISLANVAKLVNTFSKLVSNTDGIVNNISDVTTKIKEENKDDMGYKDENFVELVDKETTIENKEDPIITYDLQPFYIHNDNGLIYYNYINDAGDATCKLLSEIGKHSISYFDIYQ